MKKAFLFLITFSSFAVMANELTNAEKEAIVKDIYLNVYNAKGMAKDAPALKFDTDATSHIAYMKKDTDGLPFIGFESKAFDVCSELGDRRDDAIAFLLGHELSHHLMDHHWGEEFRSAYSLGALEKEIKIADLSNAKRFETQADEKGGILCYMAGYSTKGIGPLLLEKLYKAYGLKDGPKYPTLEQRMKIAKETDSLVSTYIKVFETANYSMLIGEFDLAIDCYKFVTAKGFDSREIYNNFGVAYFLKGAAELGPDDMKYLYPVEIDLDSKLRARAAKGMGPTAKQFFDNALEKFEQATHFDKDYATGYLNMACTYTILEEFDDARFYAMKAVKKGKKHKFTNTVMNAEMLGAIIEDKDPNGEKESINEILDDLIFKGHILSDLNKRIINGEDLSEIDPPNVPIAWMDGSAEAVKKSKIVQAEIFDGFTDFTLMELGDVIPTASEEAIEYKQGSSVMTGEINNSRIHAVQDKNGKWVGFYVTMEDYDQASTYGIKLHDSKSKVIEKYGLPTSVTASQQGTLLYYGASRLIFLIDHKNEVARWVLVKKL